MKSRLNPNAPPYVSPPNAIDVRTLFITFSIGFPLQESQLYRFFHWWYPNTVESVYVHKKPGKSALFGKVTFKKVETTVHVLGDREQVCFSIDDIPFFCKRFARQRSRPLGAPAYSVGPRGSGGRRY